MKKYLFYNSSGVVVQVFVADISDEELSVFSSDYAKLFQSVGVISVEPEEPGWINWIVDDGIVTEPVVVSENATP